MKFEPSLSHQYAIRYERHATFSTFSNHLRCWKVLSSMKSSTLKNFNLCTHISHQKIQSTVKLTRDFGTFWNKMMKKCQPFDIKHLCFHLYNIFYHIYTDKTLIFEQKRFDNFSHICYD